VRLSEDELNGIEEMVTKARLADLVAKSKGRAKKEGE
jgi:hypothetical protein